MGASILPLAMSTSRIMEMQVKTGDWPGSGMQFSGHLSFSLCFGKQCCTINDADNWVLNFQWDHLDEFHDEDLQTCQGFEIEYSEEDGFPYHGQVSMFHTGRDGWNGQYVRVLTDTGVYWQCQLDNWIISWQWDHIDEFHTEDLQECEGFEIEYSEEEGFPYHGRVTLFHSGRDGWNGQYVRVLTDT